MLRLRVLGSQQLERPGGEAVDTVVAQPKRFAVLAYLALAGDTLVRRDTVLAVFWPELDQFAARRALRNTVYQLRRGIGSEVFRTRGDEEIGIDSTAVWCDATDLAAAVDGGRFEDAVELYRGELLRGFHLPGGEEEFESWLSAQRERTLRNVLRALTALAARDEHAGRPAAAAQWAIRAQEIAPLDEAWVRRAMTLLAASGDASAALRMFETYSRRLREEVGGTPTADASRLAARVRAEAAVPTAPVRAVSAPLPVPIATAPAAAPVASAVAPISGSAAEVGVPPIAQSAGRSKRSTGRLYVLTAGVIAIALLGATLWRRQRTQADPHRLVVSIFRNRTGDPRLESVGDMAADWISRGLFAAGLGEVIDPGVLAVRGRGADGNPLDPEQLARLTGAGTIIEGQYYSSGDSLLFVVSIADANSGRVLGQAGPIVGPIARPAAALDDVRSRAMSALAAALDPRFATRIPRMTQPPSFPVYNNFMRGWSAFYLDDWQQSQRLFAEAVRGDTTFAPAAAGWAMAAAHTNRCGLTDSLDRAWPAGRFGLIEADRLTIAIAVAHCNGDNDGRLRLTIARSRLLPRSSSTQVVTADAALWADRPTEALAILQSINPAIDLAWMPDSAHYEYYDNLAEADHLLGRYDEELAVAEQVRPTVPLAWAWLRARALVGLHRTREARGAVDTALTMRADPRIYFGIAAKTVGRPEYGATGGWVAAWIAREFFAHGDTAAGRIVAAQALAWAVSRNPTERTTFEVQMLEATTRDLTRDYIGARRVLAALLATDQSNVDVRGMLGGAAAAMGDTAVASAEDRWLAQLDRTSGSWAAPLYRARIAVRSGRPDDAVALLRTARGAGGWPFWMHCDPAMFSLRERADYQGAMAPRG